ncbi:MAG TPA: hypothetical protein VFR70_10980, partial [Flavobacterium sp.]|nr:hypothetical protein [Flavobacterium sp.]
AVLIRYLPHDARGSYPLAPLDVIHYREALKLWNDFERLFPLDNEKFINGDWKTYEDDDDDYEFDNEDYDNDEDDKFDDTDNLQDITGKRLKKIMDALTDGGYTEELMSDMESVMEEITAQEERKRKALQEDEPAPPITNVSYNGIDFKVITRQQATAYLPTVLDMDSEPLYDVWDELRFPIDDNGFFLLAEEDVITEKLELDYEIDGVNGVSVLGFIFLKNVKVLSHIIAYDTDASPALIIHGDLQCPIVYLFGNTHYVGGKVTTDLLWAEYNHGELFLNGSIDAKVIFADDMHLHISKIGQVDAFIIRGVGIHIKESASGQWLEQDSTYQIEEVFIPEVCYIDDDEVGLDQEKILQNKNFLKKRHF